MGNQQRFYLGEGEQLPHRAYFKGQYEKKRKLRNDFIMPVCFFQNIITCLYIHTSYIKKYTFMYVPISYGAHFTIFLIFKINNLFGYCFISIYYF